MEIILKRIAKKLDYTIGHLYIAGDCKSPATVGGTPQLEYFCDTLEPAWRNLLGVEVPPELENRQRGRKIGVKAIKIPGKTAIPEGRYLLLITKSYRFKRWLPEVWAVPKFSGIRIHAGNTVEDTQGCILVGKNLQVGKVLDSRIWLRRLIDRITEAQEKRNEEVWITVE